jgi:hypothetical protein
MYVKYTVKKYGHISTGILCGVGEHVTFIQLLSLKHVSEYLLK